MGGIRSRILPVGACWIRPPFPARADLFLWLADADRDRATRKGDSGREREPGHTAIAPGP